MAGSHTLFFQKLPVDERYIKANMDLAAELDGSSVVLFGYSDLVFNFQRFYPGCTLANDVYTEFDQRPLIDDPDYLVHISEIGSDEAYIESRLPIDVEFIKHANNTVSYLYLVK